MNIAIFGMGYVGITVAACLLKQGHTVIGVEVNEEKRKILALGRSPIHEPGVDAQLSAGIREGRLSIVADPQPALADAEMALVCVGTPSAPDGSHNMTMVAEVTRQIANAVKLPGRKDKLTVVYRSTMRPGSISGLIRPIFETVLGCPVDQAVEIVYNPEFLRESEGIRDYFEPPKIVIGTADGQPCRRLQELYSNMTAPTFVTRYGEAEFTKFVDNSFHALKVAFANEIARICLGMDVEVSKVHEIFVADHKLNISPRYLRPGGAFGGSCLPKDVRALHHMSEDVGANSHVIDALLRSNEAHKRFLFHRCVDGLPAKAIILMIGLAFKPDSDDLRESAQIDLARRILQHGYELSIYDVSVKPEQLMGQNLGYTYSQLPSIGDLLISKGEVEQRTFDLVIDTYGLSKQLALKTAKFVDISAL
ncbi:nucleotide sugar dehydrogenase [Bradyrhizobium iriomotense]|uniref:nucleotide sugar dehydrogenase n=1 Tax=Bradyrhizobium iriomotense TaxID=441950 RepID=UPI001B8A4C80|nr:nucleotide sugar dehydrogenase [Bradyrhizobium iriomotense]MBR1132235.1 nucleotide sugar dehydrogenase [Bradyrhizobium iriomotense]